MFTYEKLRTLVKGHADDQAFYEVGTELAQSERRIAKLLESLKRDIDRLNATVERGHETCGLDSINGSEITQLFEALGERNALIRSMKRLGVDVSKL